jgi:hypothetical protein
MEAAIPSSFFKRRSLLLEKGLEEPYLFLFNPVIIIKER